MKKVLMIPFLLIAINCQLAFSQKKGKIEMPSYPKYEDVVNQFFTKYTTLGNEQEIQLSFAKKPDGWHAILSHYLTKAKIKDELFWSRKQGEYMEIDFQHYVQAEIDPNHENLLNDQWAISASEMVPYWGYDGWEMDVINEFAGQKNLSDSLINSVARAYSSKARSFTDYNEFVNPVEFKKLPKGQNSLSPEILAKYLENQHKAIDFYYKLYKQNPKYETFVSDIFNVYSNEIMNGFLALRFYQNEETAQKELKKGLYSPFYIEMAKNYLNSCDSNAILFTNGDMDTYPLLYVQEMENFRKDVLVVNLSLMNLGRYIYHLANFKGGAKPLKLSLNPEIYKSETKEIFFIVPDSSIKISVNEIMKLVTSDDINTKYQLSDNQYYDKISSNQIYFTINKEQIKEQYQDKLSQIDSSFNIELLKNYLYLSDFCVLDIIATNNFGRPVYFASTVASDYYRIFDNFLSVEGLAYKFIPYKIEKENEYETGKIFSNILYNKITNKLQFNPLNYNDIGISKLRMITNYRYLFSRLIATLTNENESEKALQIIGYFFKYFPNNIAKLDYYSYPIITSYFKLGKIDEAKELIRICFKNCTDEIENTKKLRGNNNEDLNIRMQLASLNELLKIASENIPNDQITNDITKKYNDYIYLINESSKY